MIIKRKYEWFGYLYENDTMTKDVVDEVFKAAGSPEEWKKRVLDYNYRHISDFFNIGCGLPRGSYPLIMKRFEELDRDYPYDNGLTYKDVDRIDYYANCEGDMIWMMFVSEKLDSPLRIVGFATIKSKGGKKRICKGEGRWRPYEIG